MGGTKYCCVVGCKNSQSRNRELTFYSFPRRSWEIKKRNDWIKAIRRITSDNKPWQPNQNTRICSAHFIGGKQSNVENSPAYVPTIFPPIYKTKEISQSALARHERLLKRKEKINTSKAAKPEVQENNASYIEIGLNGTPKKAGSTNIACQTDGYEEESSEGNTFWSWNNERNEASTQTNIHIGKPHKNERIIVKVIPRIIIRSPPSCISKTS
ncbi:THAP domain-containing protein 11-like [Aricia agestis]|uniref:THAP domain-containing protein 11-like n=1 Tax=Aricia agestis TaxID=91739 RepID=UPI001C201780|nr:THAP domain-containing protein 11-like [Aricia agestis]